MEVRACNARSACAAAVLSCSFPGSWGAVLGAYGVSDGLCECGDGFGALGAASLAEERLQGGGEPP
eukprot:12880633-Prorocentrum_lima.AAC.1